MISLFENRELLGTQLQQNQNKIQILTSIFSEKISPANDGLFVVDGLFVHEGLYVYVQLT